MEEQGETDDNPVFFCEDDLGGALYEKGLAEGGFICDDIVFASLIDGELTDQVEDDAGLIGPCRADRECFHFLFLFWRPEPAWLVFAKITNSIPFIDTPAL